MKNLAGDLQCDSTIVRELLSAGIDIIPVERTKTEVPYSFIGEKNGWRFTRAWYYWVANPVAPNYGMPLDKAIKLYSITNEARVDGDCTSPHPEKRISWYDLDGNNIVIDPEHLQEDQFEKLGLPKNSLRFVKHIDPKLLYCNEGKLVYPVVKLYHIDTQVALNAFSNVI